MSPMGVPRAGASLVRAAQRGMLAALAFCALLSALAVALGYRYVMDEVNTQKSRLTQEHLRDRFASLHQQWQRDANLVTRQIEFLRYGDLPATERQASLHAFFVAQSDHRVFEGMLLAGREGTQIYAYGCGAALLDSLHFGENFHLAHCQDREGLYASLRVPLWLGHEARRGSAVFLKHLDNAFLLQLATPGTTLFLVHEGRVMASSLGDQGLALPVALAGLQDVWLQGRRYLRAAFPLEAEAVDTPQLVILQDYETPIPLSLAVTLAVALLLLLTAAFWLVLGRGLASALGRLDSLAGATQAYAERGRCDDGVSGLLERAGRHGDEIGRLSANLRQLMHQAEARMAEQAAYLETLDLLEEAVVEIDPDGRLLRASAGWERLGGLAPLCEGEPIYAAFAGEDAAVLRDLLSSLLAGDRSLGSARLRLAQREQGERWVEIRLTALVQGAGRPNGARGVLRDVTQHYLQEQQISHMALHDALTDLPNRVLLEDRLEVALRVAQRSERRVGLGFIDLDHFKNINDSYGHKTGDKVLLALATRLAGQLRKGDTIARWGGDEFVVLLQDMPDIEAVREVADKLRGAVEAPLQVDEHVFALTYSAGYAVYPDDAEEPEVLLAHADRAMFYAKSQGRNALQFFADMTSKGLGKKELYIQQRLAAAIREGRLQAHYQPQVEAASGRPVGVEALARWYEEDLGWVSPASFIPMAENLGLIRELGEQIRAQALADAARWRHAGLNLSLNVSKRQLYLPQFTERLIADVAASGLSPADIVLEVTESVAMHEVEHATERLRELFEAGFRISVDDFGTGYSSLSQLHEMPVSEIKIDIAFVRRIRTPQGGRLVQAIVQMARTFNLTCVAEGVEDEAAADRLRAYGVDLLQGYLYGAPMPAAQMDAWLAARVASSAAPPSRDEQ
jgi:diguanylate cyclase (GGDEF)-like protein/PAS domain S-box-containing protein